MLGIRLLLLRVTLLWITLWGVATLLLCVVCWPLGWIASRWCTRVAHRDGICSLRSKNVSEIPRSNKKNRLCCDNVLNTDFQTAVNRIILYANICILIHILRQWQCGVACRPNQALNTARSPTLHSVFHQELFGLGDSMEALSLLLQVHCGSRPHANILAGAKQGVC